MTFNLGSLCTKMCECGTFNFCNSSKNIVLIGNTNSDRVNTLIAENNGLMSIVSQIRGKDTINLTPTKNVRKSFGKDDLSTQNTAIRAGIIETSVRFSSRLMQANDTLEDGWKKLLLAQYISEMNLENMYRESEPLTNADVALLEKNVVKVATYYLMANILWKMGCKNDFDADKLRLHEGLDKKQVMFIKKQLKLMNQSKFFGVESFSKLEPEIQKIFLEAAKYFPKQYRQMCQLQDAYCFNLESLPQKDKDENLHNVVAITAHRNSFNGSEHKSDNKIEQSPKSKAEEDEFSLILKKPLQKEASLEISLSRKGS